MDKKLIPLLGILALLVALGLLKTVMQPKETDIQEEMGARSILPEDFLISDVEKIEIYIGAKPDKKVVLSQSQSLWTISSAFQAPGNKGLIEEFLESLKELYGEVRISGKEYFKDFQLEDQEALHLCITRKIKDIATTTHILVGKKELYNACFLRYADGEDVLRVGKELRAKMGVWSDELTKEPESNYWISKGIWKLDKASITSISLDYPEKKLAFARYELPPEKAETPNPNPEKPIQEEPSFLPDGKEPAKKEADAPKEKKYAWKLTAGGVGDKFTDSELESLLDALSNLECNTVVDPNQKTQWNLQPPMFRLEVTLEDGSKKILWAGQSEAEKEGYCYVEGKPELVYQISTWTFNDRLFKKGSKFFILPCYKPEKAQVKEISLATPTGTIIMNRVELDPQDPDKASWTLPNPTNSFVVHKQTADLILTQLQYWKFEDYTDETKLEAVGLDKPEYTLTVTLKDDSKHTLKLGKESKSIRGRYGILDDQKVICMLAKADFEKLFPEFTKLLVNPADEAKATQPSETSPVPEQPKPPQEPIVVPVPEQPKPPQEPTVVPVPEQPKPPQEPTAVPVPEQPKPAQEPTAVPEQPKPPQEPTAVPEQPKPPQEPTAVPEQPKTDTKKE